MKKSRIFVLIVIALVLCWSAFFIVDNIRASKDKTPIFSIYSASYDDGGSKKYTGFMYNVYVLHYYNPEMTKDWENEDGSLKDEYKDKEFITGVKIVPWFYSIDKVK